MRRRTWLAGGVTAGALLMALVLAFTTLRGSKEKMIRQNTIARENNLAFARTPDEVQALVARGELVPLPGSVDYTTKGVSFPYARPEVLEFVERVAREQRVACGGEPLVITSLVRPISTQPRNASQLSVHPAGMAVDLHKPDSPECRAWLADRLLEMAAANVLDVTEERRPPHLHVAVFPRAFTIWLAKQPAVVVPEPTVLAAEPATPPSQAPRAALDIRSRAPHARVYRDAVNAVVATLVTMLLVTGVIALPLRVRSRRRARRAALAQRPHDVRAA